MLAPSVLRLVIHEGRNRQVRRMCQAVGHPVQRLVRTRIGPVRDTNLPPGRWRYLEAAEVRALAAAVGPRTDLDHARVPQRTVDRTRSRFPFRSGCICRFVDVPSRCMCGSMVRVYSGGPIPRSRPTGSRREPPKDAYTGETRPRCRGIFRSERGVRTRDRGVRPGTVSRSVAGRVSRHGTRSHGQGAAGRRRSTRTPWPRSPRARRS